MCGLRMWAVKYSTNRVTASSPAEERSFGKLRDRQRIVQRNHFTGHQLIAGFVPGHRNSRISTGVSTFSHFLSPVRSGIPRIAASAIHAQSA